MFAQKELASSISCKGAGNGTLSTKSGTEEEKSLSLTMLLQRAKLVAQSQLKDNNTKSVSLVSMKEETSKDQMIAWTEQEFVNVIKIRKVA